MTPMIRERILRLEQTLERLFGGRPPRAPLEIRRAVVEGVLAQVQPVGRGRRILPFDHVTLHIVAEDAAARRVFKDALDPDDVAAEIRRELERGGVQPASGFSVSVRFARSAGKGWAPGARFHMTVAATGAAADGAAATPEAAPARPERPRAELAAALVLRVTHGDARPKTLTTSAVRVNLGRQVEVLDQAGRPVRRNDVAFIGEDDVSRSVSRAHAHIAFEASSGSHRLYDENSAYGTEIERAGRRIVVPAGRDGLKVRPGDVIHLGRAALRFELKAD
jgi:hypothetical protein